MSDGVNGNDVSTGRVRSLGTPAVRTEALWKVYEHDGIRVEAVRDVTLTIEQGEFVVLAGPSGSGKSTMLNILGCLDKPTSGRYELNGKPTHKMRGAKLIACDIRLSNTASMADYWLPPRPGTEALMLLGMTHVILEDGEQDDAFMRRWVDWRGWLQAHPDAGDSYEDFVEAGAVVIGGQLQVEVGVVGHPADESNLVPLVRGKARRTFAVQWTE